MNENNNATLIPSQFDIIPDDDPIAHDPSGRTNEYTNAELLDPGVQEWERILRGKRYFERYPNRI